MSERERAKSINSKPLKMFTVRCILIVLSNVDYAELKPLKNLNFRYHLLLAFQTNICQT